MEKIAFFMNSNEVGGNKVMLNVDGCSIWLDFGLSLKQISRYFNYVLEGRQLSKIDLKKLAEKELIPSISTLEERVKIVVSHAHLDHYGGIIPLLHHGIKVELYAPEDTLKLIKARLSQNISVSLLENIAFYPLHVNTSTKINDCVRIVPIEVDHSIDASYSYILFTDNHTLFYTGDIRFDYVKIRDIIDSVKKHTESIDYMLTEFTGVLRRSILHEQDIENVLKDILVDAQGLIVIFTTGTYSRRFSVFKHIAEYLERDVVIYSSLAYLLYALGKVNLVDYIWISKKKQRMPSWEKELLKNVGYDRIINEDYIKDKSNQKSLILIMPPLHKLKLDFELEPGGIAITSLSEPFDEEGFISQRRLENFILDWLEFPVYHVHASGHAAANEIRKLVLGLNPRKGVYVFHSPAPEVFTRMVPFLRNIETRISFSQEFILR